MQLTRLAEDYEKIKQAGAVELITISADNQNYSCSMALSNGAKYPIFDADRSVIKILRRVQRQEHEGIAIFGVSYRKTGRIQSSRRERPQ